MKTTRHSANLLLAAHIVAVGATSAAYGQQCASSFASAGKYVTAQLPKSVAIGDLNGDGKADLAVANSGLNNISVLLNTSPMIGIIPQPVSQSVVQGQNAD